MSAFFTGPDYVDPNAPTLEKIGVISLPEKTMNVLEVFKNFGIKETPQNNNAIEFWSIKTTDFTFTFTLTKDGNTCIEMTDLQTQSKTCGTITLDGQELEDLKAIYPFLDWVTYQQGITDLLNFIMEEQAGPHRMDISWQYEHRMGVGVETPNHWDTIKWRKDNRIEITQGSLVTRIKTQTNDPHYTKLFLENDGYGMGLKNPTAKTLTWIEGAMGKQGRLLILKHQRLSTLPSA